jgi:Fis family transcriptional regulator
MKTGAARLASDEDWQGFTVLRKNYREPLNECVRNALRFYLRHLGDYEVNDLHRMVMAEVERPTIEAVLEHTQGNQTRTASMLGMSRSTLRKKMSHYGINREG